ncbi:MAG TPA: lamin tail domain-containing protein, partial [Nocardioides sp.]|nr:lamin tail domain-containing protein [Nocardioides sp.]
MPSRRSVAVALGLGLAASALTLSPAPAHAASSGLVITEVYGAGGNSGADLNADYVELKNVSSAPISLNGKSLQYRSSGGVAAANGVANLSGTVPAGEHFLVQTSPEADPDGAELGPADLVVTGVNMSGTAGTVWLANTQSNMTLPTGSILNAANVIDLVGFGGTNTSEVAPTAVLSLTTSAKRTNENVDGDNNGADFSVGAQSPTA